ncbi:hypothetical protein AB0K05_25320 [Nonomuraea sp. NPDC049486]|uniref:hypothetical protein n=1 Tax=Nonomuraea sp. NPDC049486 TaxID=3155773 RepID=UPI00341F2CEC
MAGCWAVADIPLDGHRDALIDARAAAELLRRYLMLAHPNSPWAHVGQSACVLSWPAIPRTDILPVRRGVSAECDTHFLARLLDRLPQAADTVCADPYFALLDQVLLGHHISAAEADALIALAAQLDLGRAGAVHLHHDYLNALAHAAEARQRHARRAPRTRPRRCPARFRRRRCNLRGPAMTRPGTLPPRPGSS